MTATAPPPSSPLDAISYEDLYRRWERGNWRASELDFTEDRVQWRETYTELERKAALWNYALFFHGEDSVADNLSPYIDAAPREEQKYFLATQQVDEARHAVFFGRFMHEVVEAGNDVASSLEATRPELTWGFNKVFARLDRMADELRADRSRPRLAAAVALYHIVIEATMAQPGQHFIERSLESRNLLPGFREGMAHVAADEQRHIGFGVKLISDLVAEDPECAAAIGELLREVQPWVTAVFVPPDFDRSYTEVFDFTLEEIYAEGAQSLETKMRSAGLPLDALPGGSPIPTDLSPLERAQRGITLLQAGIVGEKHGTPTRDPEVVATFFDQVRRTVDPAAGPFTLQWDFRDLDPWHIVIDDGATRAVAGRSSAPDVTFRCTWEDWVDVSMGRVDGRRAVLSGRLRMKGRPRALLRVPSVFTRS